jgi:hypothetical protein
MNNIVSLVDHRLGYQLAIVDEVDNGRAKTVVWQQKSEKPISVYGHLSHVPNLKPFDEVLIIETDKGIVITGVLAEKAQAPAALITQEGKAVVIRCESAIRLENPHANIELSADGKVIIEGKAIYQQSDSLMSLKGHPIELN